MLYILGSYSIPETQVPHYGHDLPQVRVYYFPVDEKPFKCIQLQSLFQDNHIGRIVLFCVVEVSQIKSQNRNKEWLKGTCIQVPLLEDCLNYNMGKWSTWLSL